MSLTFSANRQNVAFSSYDNIDKIVAVFEGSYDKSTATTRTDGFTGTIYAKAITHGFTRPVFTSLLWSEDNITWADGGGANGSGNYATAFSDSTNIYIGSSSNSGTLYYKVIAYWIDDYDSTNPLVPAFSGSSTKAWFDSRENYQKIAVEGSTTYGPGTFSSTETKTVTHNLNYLPNAKAFFESISGEVWPMMSGGATNPFLYTASQDEAELTISTTNISITAYRSSNAIRKIWYRIYYDA